jgi:hypothetical protein
MMGANSMRAAALTTGRAFVSGPSEPAPAVDMPGVGARGGGMFVITIDHAARAAPDGWGP